MLLCTVNGSTKAESVSIADDAAFSKFTSQLFGHLPRADQHRLAKKYLTALLATPGKKSIRRLAHTVSASPTTVQSLRQFVNLSPWDWNPVLRELTRWVAGHGSAPAWSIGRALLPKRGEQTVGVHRYFDPISGRTLNCQVGIGLFLHIGTTHLPVDWRLFLPKSWFNDRQLRQRARIPDAEHYRPLWAHALGLVKTLAERTASAPLVADMSDDPHVRSLIDALNQHGHSLVIAVPQHVKVLPSGRGPSTPPLLNAKACLSSGTTRDVILTSAADGKQRRARIVSLPVRLSDSSGSPSGQPYQLFAECGPDNRPDSIWITTFPERALAQAVSLTTLADATASAVSNMERSVGLLDFEGRSFPGWHHHMTLVSAAYAFQSLGRRCSDPGLQALA
ncbi:transposase [Streptomyces sp. P9-2B-2]|uniref:IS701 family transposase n=1 Tax=Streptomyces sp. P9-2B-2 TaxID=3057114 RepID=UPI0025B4A09F|nr:transposase [Streptomyces sp. P9-2B-2]WJY37074.1 transposase [Streptomyces sp. P9-2B-2]